MELIIKRSNEIVANEWSGGTTSQIYIYPEDKEYSERDFDYRISSAVVKDLKSTFTKLEGFDRHIMVLDGAMYLHHENDHEAYLNEFDKDLFSGSCNTTSEGVCTDFNLMVRKGRQGDIFAINKNRIDIERLEELEHISFYFLADVGFCGEQFHKGDFVIVKEPDLQMTFETDLKDVFVICSAVYKQ